MNVYFILFYLEWDKTDRHEILYEQYDFIYSQNEYDR